MKKITFFLMIFVLILSSNVCLAKTDKELLSDLNKTIELLTKTKIQYEQHSRQFNAYMPYAQVISGRGAQIDEIKQLIKKLNKGTHVVEERALVIDEADSIFDALLIDGSNEVKVIEVYNMLLLKHKDEQLQKIIRLLRDQAISYYMLFDNTSQVSMLRLFSVP